MTFRSEDVRRFWEERARRHADDPGLTNLEEDPALRVLKTSLEDERVEEHLGTLDPDSIALDLGGGNGYWAFRLASRVREVHVVDFCAPLIESGRRKARDRGVSNVWFTHAAAQDYESARPFDLIFVSGLLIYLDDADLARLASRIADYSRNGTTLILRDGTGIRGRFEINRWSEALAANYAAIYRTRDEYVALFQSIGFVSIRDQDVFTEGCALNKWPETRLRIYRFERERP